MWRKKKRKYKLKFHRDLINVADFATSAHDRRKSNGAALHHTVDEITLRFRAIARVSTGGSQNDLFLSLTDRSSASRFDDGVVFL